MCKTLRHNYVPFTKTTNGPTVILQENRMISARLAELFKIILKIPTIFLSTSLSVCPFSRGIHAETFRIVLSILLKSDHALTSCLFSSFF